jgi:hypothetical protein
MASVVKMFRNTDESKIVAGMGGPRQMGGRTLANYVRLS